jgi:hypothetical protein
MAICQSEIRRFSLVSVRPLNGKWRSEDGTCIHAKGFISVLNAVFYELDVKVNRFLGLALIGLLLLGGSALAPFMTRFPTSVLTPVPNCFCIRPVTTPFGFALLIMLIVSIVLVIIGATEYFLNRRSLRKMRSDAVEP